MFRYDGLFLLWGASGLFAAARRVPSGLRGWDFRKPGDGG